MRAHQAEYPVAMLCRVLQVSESRYYGWQKRTPSARARRDAEGLALIAASQARSAATYGAPPVHEDLAEAGQRVGRMRDRILQRSLELARDRYRAGYASYLEELDAQRNLFSAQREAITIREGRLANLVTLYETLGGGWAGTPAEAR